MTTPPPTGTWLVVTLGPLGLLEAPLLALGLGLVDEAVLLGSDPDAVAAADDWDAPPADVSLEQAASTAGAPPPPRRRCPRTGRRGRRPPPPPWPGRPPGARLAGPVRSGRQHLGSSWALPLMDCCLENDFIR